MEGNISGKRELSTGQMLLKGGEDIAGADLYVLVWPLARLASGMW